MRLLSGETCTALSETVVVILALSIDPGADTTAASFPVEEPPADGGPRVPAVVAPEERHEARAARASDDGHAELPRDAATPDRPSLQLAGVLRVFGELGIMPGPAFGGAVALRAQRGALSGEASAAALLPKKGTLADEDTRGGHFSWFGGQLVGCLSSISGVTLAGCVGGEIGRLSGTGTGVDVQETRHAAWFGPLLSVRTGLPLAHHAIFETELALVLPLSRPTFALEQLGEVHTPAVVSGRVGAGIRWP